MREKKQDRPTRSIFMRMEFVKGTSISFADSFNECESETKALGIFS